MKYFIKKLNLPQDVQNIIYSFIDYTEQIRNLPAVWYKRLIDCKLYAIYNHWYDTGNCYIKCMKRQYYINLCFERERNHLLCLVKQKAWHVINYIHSKHVGLF